MYDQQLEGEAIVGGVYEMLRASTSYAYVPHVW